MDPLLTILKRLLDHKVDLVMIGGMAAMFHGSTTVTWDIDFCVPFDEPTMAKILAAIGDIKPTFRMRPDKMPLWNDARRLAGLNLLAVETRLGIVDFLKEVSGVGEFAQVVASSQIVEAAPSVSCRILTLDALINAKRAAGRPKDRAAVVQLEIIRSSLKSSPKPLEE